MGAIQYNLLLADDDADDCMFFKEALEELPVTAFLTTVNDGEQLMSHLTAGPATLPDMLFLDMNMPRKTGLECLSEIKRNEKLKHLPVIIYSTSLDAKIVNLLYEEGAHYYIRKPGDFLKIKQVIYMALISVSQKNTVKSPKDKFVIQV